MTPEFKKWHAQGKKGDRYNGGAAGTFIHGGQVGPAKEKQGFAITEKGHAFDTDRAKIIGEAQAKLVELGHRHGVLNYKDAPKEGIGKKFVDALRFGGDALPSDVRHAKYVEGKHREGKNAYNPFGGMLTPSDHEEGGTPGYFGETKTKHKFESKDYRKEKKSSLLLAIASTISERDADTFVEKVANDPTLRAGFRRSGIADTLVEAFDLTKRASAGERLEALADRIEPTCITFQKLPGGDFLVKSANKNAFQQGPDAKGQVVPQEEVAQAMGPENAQAMKPGQTATAVTDPAQGAAPPAENKSKIIDEFCQCKVQDMMGNSLIGNCFPQSLAWDGAFTPSPIAIFTNGSVYAMQDTVAGELLGKATNLPSDAPRGDGVFYSTEGGEAICTAPVTIGSSAAGPDGLPVLMGTDSFGTQLQISMAEGLKSPQRISDVEYALPASWKFMRLNNQTQLVPDPSQMNKQASARAEGGSVTLFYNGGYHLSGGCGLEKLSADYRHDLDPVSAEFMLGVLGVDGVTAKQKVAEARKRGSVKLAGLHTITTLAERYAGATKTASALMSKIPNLRRDLTKEAASIEDQGTVDSILSLNFINPENLATFVSYVPQLEMCGEKLAEMLLSSYLGMQELPEGAIDRAMKNLEEVIQGLKNIEHSMGGEDQPQ